MKKDIISLQMMVINAVVVTVVMNGYVVKMVVGTGDSGGDGESSVDGGTGSGAVVGVARCDDAGERQSEGWRRPWWWFSGGESSVHGEVSPLVVVLLKVVVMECWGSF